MFMPLNGGQAVTVIQSWSKRCLASLLRMSEYHKPLFSKRKQILLTYVQYLACILTQYDMENKLAFSVVGEN